MNVSSPLADAGVPRLDSTNPSSESAPRTRLHRSPLATVAGWRWAGIKREAFPEGFSPSGKKTVLELTLSRPRRMRRCARGVLLWVLLWYAVAQLFPILLKDRWQRIGPANECRKWPALRQLVARDPDRPLLLMLGSSRACWAFRAGVLDGMPDSDGRPLHVYNFGIPATGPIYELFYLRDMLAEGIRPRFVLIEFLPPLLCEPQRGALTEEGMTGFEDLSASRLLQWAPYLHRPGKRVRAWLESRIAPWYAFRRGIQLDLKCLLEGEPFPSYPAVDDWGWTLLTPLPWPAEERERRLEVAKGGYAPGLSRFRLGKKPAQALRELLDLCRREQIPAALVVMPESSQFRSWYSDAAKTAIRGLLDELSQTYGVEVIDAQCWLADDDFEDGHHALLHGANVFTYRLHAELPRLLAQSKVVKSD
jgi:hypothetical protein